MEVAKLFIGMSLRSSLRADYRNAMGLTRRFTSQFSRALIDAARTASARMGQFLRRGITVGLGALTVGGGALALASRRLIQLGSDAEETGSLIRTSLGPATDGFNQRLATFAQNAGRSFFELQEGTSTIIAMTRSMGFGQQEAANFSASLGEIATDLGSFFNRSTEDVFLDLQSALAGSSETLQKYGIDVRETTLKQLALDQGIIKNATETLPRQARALLIQQAIMQQAGDAIGDAIRTNDSFSNSLRAIQGAATDAGTNLGVLLRDGIGRDVLNAVRSALPAIIQFGAGFLATFQTILRIGAEFTRELASLLGFDLAAIADNAESHGQNLAVQFARGIANGIAAIIGVINQIASVIAFWMKPQSPPRFLPDIDKWGEGTVNAYLDGFDSADFGILDELSGRFETYFRSITPEDDLPARLLEIRDVLIETVALAQTDGSENALDHLRNSLQGLPAELSDLATALFDVESAQQRVEIAAGNVETAEIRVEEALDNAERAARDLESAQRDLNSATADYAQRLIPLQSQLADVNERQRAFNEQLERQRLNEVTSGASAELRLQLDRLRFQEDQIRNQEQIASLTETINSADATQADRDVAALKLQQLEISQQIASADLERSAATLETDRQAAALRLEELDAAGKIRDFEAQRDQALQPLQDAVEAAQSRLESAESQVEAARETLEAAKEGLELANQDLTAANERLTVQQNIVDEIQKQRDLMGEVSEIQAQQIADALRFGGGGGDGGAEDAQKAAEEAAEAINSAFEGIQNPFETLFADVDAQFDPVREQIDTLTETLGGIRDTAGGARENVIGFFNEAREAIDPFIPVIVGVIAALGGFFILSTIAGYVGAFFAALSQLGVALAAAQIWFATSGTLLGSLVTLLGGPVTIAIAGVAALVGLLAAAWSTNFLGIRDIVNATWNNSIRPAFAFIGETIRGDMIPAFVLLWESVRPIIIPLGQLLGVVLVGAITIVLGAINGLVVGFANLLQGAVLVASGIVQIVSGLVSGVVELFRLLIAWTTGDQESVAASLQRLHEIAAQIWDGIGNVFVGAITGIIGAVAGFIGGIIDWFTHLYDVLVGNSIVPDLVNAVLEWFTTMRDSGVTLVTELMQRIIDAILARYETVRSAIAGVVAIVQNAFQLDWAEIGRNIVSGIVNGIRSGIGAIASAAQNAAQSALNAAKSALGIQSPSRAFMELGAFSSEGLALGILENLSVVKAASEQLTQAALIQAQASTGIGNRPLIPDFVNGPTLSAENIASTLGGNFGQNTVTNDTRDQRQTNIVINSPVPITDQEDLLQNVRLLGLLT